MSRFVDSGEQEFLRRSLGHYVRRGYGGRTIAAQRLAPTAQTAAGLFSVLARGRPLPPHPDAEVSRRVQTATTAHEIMDALVEVVRPIDGSQDAEGSRRSIREALAEVLDAHPDADLLQLTAEQRNLVIERFIAYDVFQRFYLDMGKALQSRAADATAALEALDQVWNFISQEVAAQFRAVVRDEGPLTERTIMEVAERTLQTTLEVFEEIES